MSSTAGASAPADPAANRPKRVRTGCLTCRERHLKCDEGSPDCHNCKKSGRECKRGVRLNFIDTQCKTPPITPPMHDWEGVSFQDESREIASEYKGGLGRYAHIVPEDLPMPDQAPETSFDFTAGLVDDTSMPQPALPSLQSFAAEGMEVYSRNSDYSHDPTGDGQGSVTSDSTFSSATINPPSHASYPDPQQTLTPPSEPRGPLNSAEELLFMQVFVEEVGLWMDSMDPYKHFSRLLPFDALQEPMLLNAFLACGARHLTLVNPAFSEDKALRYYDEATRQLLRCLQNPNRNTVTCATTAVILNVYEIMSERALQRMNHIAGARALIKECGWSAKSVGIGAACFWLNVGMEVLSCLHFNWQVAWDPDTWGIDMDFSQAADPGHEEIWTYRILYLVAKVANFKSSTPRFNDPNQEADNIRLRNRFDEWNRLKDWCDSWNSSVPRTMQPLGYLFSYQTRRKSAFPEVWLIKRTTVIARLFYHTTMCMLARTNPVLQGSQEMHDLEMNHAHDLCGIVAHVKDRGVASVATRSLAIAAECLTSRVEQEEVLQILTKIREETGWQISFMHAELKRKWGWNEQGEKDKATAGGSHQQSSVAVQQQQQQQSHQSHHQHVPSNGSTGSMSSFGFGGQIGQQQQAQSNASGPAPSMMGKMPKQGIVNPILRMADFSAPMHPYQSHYVPPIQSLIHF